MIHKLVKPNNEELEKIKNKDRDTTNKYYLPTETTSRPGSLEEIRPHSRPAWITVVEISRPVTLRYISCQQLLTGESGMPSQPGYLERCEALPPRLRATSSSSAISSSSLASKGDLDEKHTLIKPFWVCTLARLREVSGIPGISLL